MRVAFGLLNRSGRVPGCPGPLLFCVLALSACVLPARAAGPADPAALRERANRVFADLRQSLTGTGTSPEKLQADLIALAGDLTRAGLDSLASEAHLGAANALVRLSRHADSDAQCHAAIAAAVRARDRHRVMRARLRLIENRTSSDPASALKMVRQVIPEIRALRDGAMLGNAYATEGRTHEGLGNFEEALIAHRKAADLAGRAGDLHARLLALTKCSQALRFLMRHPEALAITDSVIVLARRTNSDAALGRALFERASMLRTTLQYDAALATIDEAIAIQQRRRDRNRLQSARLLRGNTLFALERYTQAAVEAESLLTWPEVRASMGMLPRVVELRAISLLALGRAREADAVLAASAESIERLRGELRSDQELSASGEHVDGFYAAWTRTKLALGRPREAVAVAERGRAVALERRLQAASLLDLPALQRRLRETSAALILYDSPDPRHGNVLIIAPDTVAGHGLRAPGLLASDLAAITDRAASARALGPAGEAAARLSEALLEGAWPCIARGIERVVIVPPARIEGLPFELLPAPVRGGPARIGDRFAVSYVQSASVFMALDRRAAPQRGVVVLADPAVDERSAPIAALDPALRGNVRRRLHGARDEARWLEQHGAKSLVGRDATLERLLATPAPGILHFATHAFEDPRDRAKGGLVLAGRDAVLSPERVESLDLGVDLVTLAGCGTLGRRANPGEGSIGLARAFLISGARSVIATRWDVSDRAASAFMREFYTALASGAARDRSLASARARLEARGFPPRDCWAFTLVGVGDRPVPAWAGSLPGKSRALAK